MTNCPPPIHSRICQAVYRVCLFSGDLYISSWHGSGLSSLLYKLDPAPYFLVPTLLSPPSRIQIKSLSSPSPYPPPPPSLSWAKGKNEILFLTLQHTGSYRGGWRNKRGRESGMGEKVFLGWRFRSAVFSIRDFWCSRTETGCWTSVQDHTFFFKSTKALATMKNSQH